MCVLFFFASDKNDEWFTIFFISNFFTQTKKLTPLPLSEKSLVVLLKTRRRRRRRRNTTSTTSYQ